MVCKAAAGTPITDGWNKKKQTAMKTTISPRTGVTLFRREVQTRRCRTSRTIAMCIGVFALLAYFFSVSLASALSIQLISIRDTSIVPPAGGNGDSLDAVVSPNGRYVVFASAAGDLVPNDDRQFNSDVFLYDRMSNTITLVSHNLSGTGGGSSHSVFGQVSTDGRYVVFQSQANDLVANDTNWFTQIFVRDLTIGTTRLVSVALDGGPGNGAASDAVMTPDGRYVAFVSAASNLVAADTNGIPDIFVRDLMTGTTRLVSVGAASYGSTTASMATPAITPDGRYVAFFSSAAGLGAPNPPTGEIYVRDLVNNSTMWASSNAHSIVSSLYGTVTNYASYHPRLSDDGK